MCDVAAGGANRLSFNETNTHARSALASVIGSYNRIMLTDPPQSPQQLGLYYDRVFETVRQRSDGEYVVNQSYVDMVAAFFAAGACECSGGRGSTRDGWSGVCCACCVLCACTGGSAVSTPESEVNASTGYVWEVLANGAVVFGAMNESHLYRYEAAVAMLSASTVLTTVCAGRAASCVRMRASVNVWVRVRV